MDTPNPLEISGNRQDGRSFFVEIPALEAVQVNYHERVGELDQRRSVAFANEDRTQLSQLDLETRNLEAEHARRIREIKTGGTVINLAEGGQENHFV